MWAECFFHLLLSLLVDGGEQLHEEDRVEQVKDDRLEVEEVGIAWEAVDPSHPHEEGVLEWVHEAKDDDHLALDVFQEKSVVQAQCKYLQVHVQERWVVREDHAELCGC